MFRHLNKDKFIEIINENVFTYAKIGIMKIKFLNNDNFIKILNEDV